MYVIVEAGLRGIEVCIIVTLIYMMRDDVLIAPYNPLPSLLSITGKRNDDEEAESIKRLQWWLETQDVRRYLDRVFRSHRKYFIAVCVLLLILVVGNALSEFAHIVTYQVLSP